MLTAIRDCYWIPRGREVVKKFIRRCVVCKKYGGKLFPHDVPPSSPECRVEKAPPRTNTGVDYAGPLHVLKRNSAEKSVTEKVYTYLLVHMRFDKGYSFRDCRRLFSRTVFIGLPPLRGPQRSSTLVGVG
jgi:hypothetical protein